jgi:hypothetical protein
MNQVESCRIPLSNDVLVPASQSEIVARGCAQLIRASSEPGHVLSSENGQKTAESRELTEILNKNGTSTAPGILESSIVIPSSMPNELEAILGVAQSQQAELCLLTQPTQIREAARLPQNPDEIVIDASDMDIDLEAPVVEKSACLTQEVSSSAESGTSGTEQQ